MRAKGAKGLKEDLEAQAKQKQMDDFIEKYRVKGGNLYDPKTRTLKLPVMWPESPEKALKVRDLEIQGIKDLADSFMIGVQMMVLIAVMWLDYPNEMARLRDLNNIFFDDTQKAPPRPIYMIDGNHRCHGMQECHQCFPRKPLYLHLNLILLILPRNRTNLRQCLYIGNAKNYSTGIYVKATQWQIVKQFRRQWEEYECDLTLTPEERVKLFSTYKSESQPTIPFEPSTCHTFSALCSVSQNVWEKIEKIFNGEYKINKNLKGQTTPTAMTHFMSMSGIPSHLLVTWLQRVLDGEYITRTFQQRCQIHTKQIRVSRLIVEFIALTKPNYMFTTIEGVATIYPKVQDPTWFDTVVKCSDDAVKSKLTDHAKSLILKMMQMQEAEDDEPVVLIVFGVVYVFVFLFSTLTFPGF